MCRKNIQLRPSSLSNIGGYSLSFLKLIIIIIINIFQGLFFFCLSSFMDSDLPFLADKEVQPVGASFVFFNIIS